MFKLQHRDTQERRYCLRCCVFIVNFEQVNAGWVETIFQQIFIWMAATESMKLVDKLISIEKTIFQILSYDHFDRHILVESYQ